jgi:UDP-N-acetylenolpyruvoylglucosamine reductase
LVNRGGATARDIVALRDEVQQRVFDLWGVRLKAEPEFVGFNMESAEKP